MSDKMGETLETIALVLAIAVPLALFVGYKYRTQYVNKIEAVVIQASKWLKENELYAKAYLGNDGYDEAMEFVKQVDDAIADGQITIDEMVGVFKEAYPLMKRVIRVAYTKHLLEVR